VTIPRKEDLSGRRYGRLLVIEYAETKNYSRQWRCRCECGAETQVSTSKLNSGNTRSCGCLFTDMARERARLLCEANRTHGMTRTPTWSSWRGMVLRCTVPVTYGWPWYGGANPPVKIDPRWVGEGGFERFLEDVGERPEGTTLGRIGDTGDYVPGNAKWMTKAEQAEHRAAKRARAKEAVTCT
jgi:hypothetical protein